MSEDVQLKEKKQQKPPVEQVSNKPGEKAGGKDVPPLNAPPMPSSLSLVVVLGLIAMLSGVLVVLVYGYTAPIIAKKERLALEAAVFQVIPGASADRETVRQFSFSLTAADGLVKLDEESADKANLHAVYDSSNALLGLAMEGDAQGYQDIVRTLFGYNPDTQKIIGMTVLKSVDTPGLGDKSTVEKNKNFMANFQALDVSLTEDGSAIAHPIETVKHGTKTQPWQVDAMSGATISSRAIAKGMRETTTGLLPLLAKHLPEVRSAAVVTETKVKN